MIVLEDYIYTLVSQNISGSGFGGKLLVDGAVHVVKFFLVLEYHSLSAFGSTSGWKFVLVSHQQQRLIGLNTDGKLWADVELGEGLSSFNGVKGL